MGSSAVGEVVALPSAPGGARRRRRWALDQKLAIVRELEASGEPVAVVARRYGMNANHLFIWRQKARAGTLGQDLRRRRPVEQPSEPMRFIDLGVVGHAGESDRCASAGRAPLGGTIEIALPGGIVVRIGPGVTSDALRQALMAVKAVL